MKNITAIIVVYNTPKLVIKAVRSLKKFYPKINIILVNNSTDSYRYEQKFGEYDAITVYNLKQNIGHGPGLHFAMNRIATKYALFMDSDAEIKQAGVLEEMIKEVGADLFYGIGQIVRSDDNGFNIEQGIKYLHPHFCLIDREMYFEFSGAINHGSPMIRTMKEIHEAEMDDLLLFDFPVADYVKHEGRGTRNLNGGKGPSGWLKNWDKV